MTYEEIFYTKGLKQKKWYRGKKNWNLYDEKAITRMDIKAKQAFRALSPMHWLSSHDAALHFEAFKRKVWELMY